MAEEPPFNNLPKDKLTEQDIALVRKHPEDVRSNAVKYIAIFYREGKLAGDQSALAEKLFRDISEKDKNALVRRSLSEQLKDCDKPAPRDVIMLLSADASEVAAPLLTHYQHFSPEEVQKLAETSDNTKRSYLASRKDVKEPLSAFLIGTDSPEVISALLKNSHAQIQEEKYTDIIKKFPEHEGVLSALIGREEIPDITVVKVSQSTTGEILKELYQAHRQRFEKAELKVEAEEGKTLKLTVPIAFQTDIVFDRVAELGTKAEHIPYLALCMGHIEIFEHLLFQGQHRMSVEEFQEAVSKEAGFERLYRDSSFDQQLMMPVKMVYRVARRVYTEKSPIPREIHKALVAECLNPLATLPEGKVLADLIRNAYDY